MNMQDNELDNLFRTKLNGLEVEPDAHVWENISAELEPNKKKSIVPVLRIAASVLVVLSIGTWLAIRPVKPVTGGKAGSRVVRVNTLKPATANAETIASQSTEPEATHTPIATHPVTSKNNTQLAKAVKPAGQKSLSTTNTTGEETEPAATQPEQLATVETGKLKPVLPEGQLTITADAEPIQPKTVQTVAAVSEEQTAKKRRKRGIASFGDLINVVVAKVDKREDKLVEFTDTDGDDATITGLNLGIIKVKKEK